MHLADVDQWFAGVGNIGARIPFEERIMPFGTDKVERGIIAELG